MAADALFPTPLHLVRRIEDPIARTTTTVHEYCAGNRIITVNGDRVAIVDYEKQQLTEIDRVAGTYSLTSFADIARTQPPRSRIATNASKPSIQALGVKGRLETFAADVDDAKLEVGVDRRVTLSRDALDVLIGAAYPNARTEAHDAIVEAARAGPRAASNDAAPRFALPSEQTLTMNAGGQELVVRNTILSVTSELVPNELVTIPPGAQLVESRITRFARELREP